jgi:hypothetical protein
MVSSGGTVDMIKYVNEESSESQSLEQKQSKPVGLGRGMARSEAREMGCKVQVH